MTIYSPFFDQQEPRKTIVGLIAKDRFNPAGEAAREDVAVFKIKETGYLVVFVNVTRCQGERITTQHCLNSQVKSSDCWQEIMIACCVIAMSVAGKRHELPC